MKRKARPRCANCGHTIIRSTIRMPIKLRNKKWVHRCHDGNGHCKVLWCDCKKVVLPEGLEE
jgi:hypothetical protein